MAGFESVVRPSVFPDTRPTSSPATPVNDPNSGKGLITGSSGKTINLPFSFTLTASESRMSERRRRVDVARVYQANDDGTVNRDSFVDINVVNKLWMDEAGITNMRYYRRVEPADNIEIKEKDKEIGSGG